MSLRHARYAMLLAIGVLQCAMVVSCVGSDGGAGPVTARMRTILPVAVPAGTTQIPPRDLAHYATYGYSAWVAGAGEDQGRKYDLMPTGYAGSANAARLLSYFTMSDVHITDKESPAESIYFGWSAPANPTPGLFSQAYSPVCLSTTQVLDAAVRTINALHRETPLDFGICLGDVGNASQRNEVQWFIDVMDGKYITPSSGAHLGATTIDHQRPFQAAGLDPAIPWYQTIGNHDQYWMGVAFPTAKVRAAQVGTEVLNMGTDVFAANATEGNGVYVGVIDGTTPLGEMIKGGPTADFATPPTVAADANRLSVTTAASTTATYISQFRASTSLPVGHGFDQTHTGSLAACYSFEPKTNLPIKVIVLDDTCKSLSASGTPQYYGSGWIDADRLAWLTAELQAGQDAGLLMIVATHIPVNPQAGLFSTTATPQFYTDSLQSDAELLTTLHNYPNLILLMAGHRHMNTVTPQPSPDATHPELGFWEVETPSLRDFPRNFRTFDIRRNVDNSISIVTTDVDPQFDAGSVEEKSLGYAVGAARLFGNIATTDATSHVYNAELVKQLTPAMQTKIARYGTALGAGVR
jgi:metallophosphoesterase (TIGR03768 family)